MVLSILMSLILIGLGGIHFYWAFGGKYGFSEAIPTKINGEKVMHPKKKHCLMVGVVVMLFAVFYVVESGLIVVTVVAGIERYVSWLIPIIFIARAIGEFQYVGLFKRIKETTFAKMDTQIYTPLSLLIGILGVLIQLLKYN